MIFHSLMLFLFHHYKVLQTQGYLILQVLESSWLVLFQKAYLVEIYILTTIKLIVRKTNSDLISFYSIDFFINYLWPSVSLLILCQVYGLRGAWSLNQKQNRVILDFPKVNSFMSLCDLTFSWNKCHFKLSFNDTEGQGEVTFLAIHFFVD